MSLQPDNVGIYLREISKYPMLTPEQEIILARQVQQMMVINQHKEALELRLHHQPVLSQLATRLVRNINLGKKNGKTLN
ncbi:sigma-70 factor domain-containing protein [Nostoc sp. FACHB-857]|uniref:sigma-70 factor domain-containing protein n=1 Tax=Nostoc sp. FACHB-857 TaxID=2692840 RepID=UPI001682E19E|nr:sigma-70 factor domain-containing protein [Nostoc sp. FACHB-857]MBD2683657.1 hypothetical protein [Nostoc sp. FACHB-857]